MRCLDPIMPITDCTVQPGRFYHISQIWSGGKEKGADGEDDEERKRTS